MAPRSEERTLEVGVLRVEEEGGMVRKEVLGVSRPEERGLEVVVVRVEGGVQWPSEVAYTEMLSDYRDLPGS